MRYVQDARRPAGTRGPLRLWARATPTDSVRCTPTSCLPRTRLSDCARPTACRTSPTRTSTTCAARSSACPRLRARGSRPVPRVAHRMNLPAGLTARALTAADVDDVVAMINDCELHDSGEPMWERADLLADTSVEGFDREHDWLGVFDDAPCVGWAIVQYRRRAFVDVHPSIRSRGVGTALRGWTEDRAGALGAATVAQVIDDRRTEVVVDAARRRLPIPILLVDPPDRSPDAPDRRPPTRDRPAHLPRIRRDRAPPDVRGRLLGVREPAAVDDRRRGRRSRRGGRAFAPTT